MKSRLIINILEVGQLQTNCYLLYDIVSKEAIIVDPGDDADYILSKITDFGIHTKFVIATHGHFDHIMGAKELQLITKAPFLINKRDYFLVKNMKKSADYFLRIKTEFDPPVINEYLQNRKNLIIGRYKMTVIETPGHTPGSISLYNAENKVMLTGDTIFRGGIGRTDFKYSSLELLKSSITKILTYPQDTVLFPGHGEKTTIAQEKLLHGLNH